MQDKVNQSLRFLVVKAHPHDFTHCAGTCGIHAAQGDSITAVSMTNGVGTHNEKLHDELLKPEAEQDPQILNQTAEDYAQGQGERVSGGMCHFRGNGCTDS